MVVFLKETVARNNLGFWQKVLSFDAILHILQTFFSSSYCFLMSLPQFGRRKISRSWPGPLFIFAGLYKVPIELFSIFLFIFLQIM